jgi:multidrug resistance efflux pump
LPRPHQYLACRAAGAPLAAGSEFSIIRPDNATGNFTKVAQRISVRIAIDPDQELAKQLVPGMSVVVRTEPKKT